MKKFLPFLFLAFAAFSYSQSQDVFQKVYDASNGFEIDRVNTMQFDDLGFLWIGGSNLDNRVIISKDNKNILQRFNGFSFDNMPLPKTENPILNIRHLFKTSNGEFYIMMRFKNGFGYYILNPITSEYKQLKIDGKFIFDGYSNVFSHQGSNYILSQTERLISLYKINHDLSTEKVFDFTSNENAFLIETSTKIVSYPNMLVISDDNFQTLYFNWKGKLLNSEKFEDKVWIDEIFKYDSINYVFTNKSTVPHNINTETLNIEPINTSAKVESLHLSTLNDTNKNHKILAYKDGFLSFYSFKQNTITNEYKLPLKNCNGITAVSNNLDEDLWLATDGKLFYFKFPSTNIKTYLPEIEIRALKPIDSNHIVVATERKGWYQLDLKKESISPITSKLTKQKINFTSSVNIIENSDHYWTSNRTKVTKVDKNTFESKHSKHYPIICLEELNDSLLVYGTNKYSLVQFNKKTQTHKPLVETDSLYIYDIAVKNHNDIVCATNKGLLHYNFRTKAKHFFGNKNLQDPFLLMVDYNEDYGFLCGSKNGFIYQYNAEQNTLNTIYKDELNAGIATIIAEEDKLWINTFNGYVNYNLSKKTLQRYSDKDGFSHNEANRYSAIKLDSLFLVGTLKGLNVFNPEDLKPKTVAANLILTKINNYNTSTSRFTNYFNQNNFKSNHTIQLPTENRALQLDFALSHIYSRNKGYSFKYRLNKREWTNLSQKNSISFPNLASGLYDLEIVAFDFSGNPIGKPLIINIKSKEFFYKNWWFILLVSITIIAVLLYCLYQLQLRKQLQEQFALDLIQSQEDERKRIARELHDGVGQQLTLIKRKAQSQAQNEISELTNATLDEVRDISRGLFPSLLKQLGFTESVEQLALDIDENNTLFVSTDISNIDDMLNEEQSLHLYRFIQECFNNILKHAKAKALSLIIEKEKNAILVTVKDNGKGFDVTAAKQQNSLGLKTLEERIKILNGDLIIESKLGEGTTTKSKINVF